MNKRPTGRPATPYEALKRRGSWLVRDRKKKNSRKEAAERREVKSPPRKPLPNTDDEWADLLCALPGYDPFRDAGDCEFDVRAAIRVIDFFELRLKHAKGPKAGQLFRLEKWQRSVVANLFGWKRPDGIRRYREALFYVPRKNGKTPFCAGLILYMLTEDGEYGAEIYGAASEYGQASRIWEHAAKMVMDDERLADLCQIFKGQQKAIQIKQDYWQLHGMSTYRVVCSDSGPAHGWNTSFGTIDELHAQADRELLDAMVTSTAARKEPLLVWLTTADYEREGSICNEKHNHAKAVIAGTMKDDSFLPVVFEAPIDADWTDEKIWEDANPNIDVSVDREHLRRECARAKELPSYENTFKRLHLNIRTSQDVRWIPLDKWDACAGPNQLDLEAFRGRDCWAGLDLSTTRDMTPLVLIFREDDGTYPILPIIWMPSDTIGERSRRDRIRYDVWAREGLIRETEGAVADYAFIRRDINALVDDFGLNIREIAVDRLFQGAQLMTELEQDGFTAFAFGQGFMSMAAPCKAFEEAVIQRKLVHGGHPILRWCAGNISVELDAAGNMKPSRRKSTEKIDPLVAAIMGYSRACLPSEAQFSDEAPEVAFS